MDIRPVDLPELRADLVRHMASERGLAQLSRFEGNPLVSTAGGGEVGHLKAGDIRSDEVARLAGADLYFVTADMAELAKTASQSLPWFELDRKDLPSEHGFVLFEEPFASYPNCGKPDASVWACCWTIVGDGALCLSFYSDWHAWLEQCGAQNIFEGDHIAYCRRFDHWLCMETFIFSPIGQRRDGFGAWVGKGRQLASVENVVRAAWLLMRQPLARVVEEKPDRATRKRLRRVGSDPKSVRVIELRRPTHSGPGDGSREFHHQWIVKGHWRQQWYPARQVHRPVWIAPHIKGPEGAPLIGGEKVYAWKR